VEGWSGMESWERISGRSLPSVRQKSECSTALMIFSSDKKNLITPPVITRALSQSIHVNINHRCMGCSRSC
jgi:hypothetical protein